MAAILPMSLQRGPRYECIADVSTASGSLPNQEARQKNRTLPKYVQHTSFLLLTAALLSALAFWGHLYYYSPAALAGSEESSALPRSEKASELVLTHGVVRGAGGVGWAVVGLPERLVDEEYLQSMGVSVPNESSSSSGGGGGGDAGGDDGVEDGVEDPRLYAAMGRFTDAIEHLSFFGELHVRSVPSPLFTAAERAEASGVLEGYLTHARIKQTARNLLCEVACDGSVPEEIATFLAEQDAWGGSMVSKHAKGSVRAAATIALLHDSTTQLGPTNGETRPKQQQTRRRTLQEEEEEEEEEEEKEVSEEPSPKEEEEEEEEEEDASFWSMVGVVRLQFQGLAQGSALRAAHEQKRETAAASAQATASSAAGGGGASSNLKGDEEEGGKGEGAAIDLSVPVSQWELQLLNHLGDLFDVKPAVLASVHREDFSAMEPSKASQRLQRSGHCTAVVKATPGFEELLWGHSSWFHYSNMNRVYKHYALHFPTVGDSGEDGAAAAAAAAKGGGGGGRGGKGVAGDDGEIDDSESNDGGNGKGNGMGFGLGVLAPTMSFSSYPGMLSSLDDFYLMRETSLSVTQTTNGIYNTSLYDLVTPFAVPAWQRVRAANALGKDGQGWAKLLATHNSGTYNNQYMVIDLKRFQRKQALAPGLLWVVEQIPGLVVDGDATSELERGYFPSYNVPFFKEIYQRSGYPLLDERRGRAYGSEYQLAPRAMILRRDASSVSDVQGLKDLLRSNGYKGKGNPKNDQQGKSSGSSAIASPLSSVAHTPGLKKGGEGATTSQPQTQNQNQLATDEGDPYAVTPWDALCSRGDLVAAVLKSGGEGSTTPPRATKSLAGCYDSKATSASLFLGTSPDAEATTNTNAAPPLPLPSSASSASASSSSSSSSSSSPPPEEDSLLLPLFVEPMSAWVVNGPTNQNQPTFSWAAYVANGSDSFFSEPALSTGDATAGAEVVSGSARHWGQPESFNFSFELMAPRWGKLSLSPHESSSTVRDPWLLPMGALVDAASKHNLFERVGMDDRNPETKPGDNTETETNPAAAPGGGGDGDDVGGSEGYRHVPLAPSQRRPIGGEKDEHGCLVAAGFSWCESSSSCIRSWATKCNQ